MQKIEKEILGAIFYRPTWAVECEIRPEWFSNSDVAKVVLRMARDGLSDPILLKEELKDYDVNILDVTTTEVFFRDVFDEYLNILKQRYKVKGQVHIYNDAIMQLTGGAPHTEVVSTVEKLTEHFLEKRNVDINIIQKVLEENFQAKQGKKIGIPTGYTDFNEYFGGWLPKNQYVIGARPGNGKTEMALDLAINVAEQGIPVAIFSFEMSDEELIRRCLCKKAGVHPINQMNGEFNELEGQLLTNAAEWFSNLPIFLISNLRKLTDVKEEYRRLCLLHGVQMVIIDHIGLMTGTHGVKDELKEISNDLKTLAKKCNCVNLVLTQMNRAWEDRGGDPRMRDIRQSGAIEEDATTVSFLVREGDLTKIVFKKNRIRGLYGNHKDTMYRRFNRQYKKFEYAEKEAGGYASWETDV